MSTARTIAAAAIARTRYCTADADRPRPAASDAWMVPAASTDPSYADPVAGAKWIADRLRETREAQAARRAQRDGKGADEGDGATSKDVVDQGDQP